MDRIVTIFPKTIYVTQSDEETLLSAKQLVKDFPELWSKSEYFKHKMHQFDVEISQHQHIVDIPAWHKVRKFIEEKKQYWLTHIWNCDPSIRPMITNSWLTATYPGQLHSQHIHPNSFLSAVYYIQVDPEVDYISFEDFPAKIVLLQTTSYNQYNEQIHTIPVKDGDLLIFLSDLYHGVNYVPESKVRPRISLAVNSIPRGDSLNGTYFFWRDDHDNDRPNLAHNITKN